jgi:ABC-type nickel/cobalt efflux system permease component RcnA
MVCCSMCVVSWFCWINGGFFFGGFFILFLVFFVAVGVIYCCFSFIILLFCLSIDTIVPDNLLLVLGLSVFVFVSLAETFCYKTKSVY